jgi:cyclopropane-fatty-acyl-phospholipid synthase
VPSGITVILDRIAERFVRDALSRCDVEIGGGRPWDIRVHHPAWYRRMAVNAPFQLGESYMDGLWDCDAIDELLFRIYSSKNGVAHERNWRFHARNIRARMRNPQTRERSGQVAERHYDQVPELFRYVLDEETMSYTCGYWRDGDSLGEAQRSKLRMICEQLDLRPGETLLDVGCGFGGLAAFAAEQYGARVVGVTNSELHRRVAQERCAHLAAIEILRLDYRDLPLLGRRFDKISSIEMIEAVGPKNLTTYMDLMYGCLRPGGRFLVQSFISHTSQHVCNEWFDRYIFPNGVSPSLAQIGAATAGSFGAPWEVRDIGTHYTPTLLAWDRNLERHWPQLSRQLDDRFRRMWHFYLTSLAGIFRSQELRLCQIAFARSPVARPARCESSMGRSARALRCIRT